jgi:hypothetical protein
LSRNITLALLTPLHPISLNAPLRLAFTWKKFRTWCTVGPLFTNLCFGQTGQTNRETQVPWISHRRSVEGRGLRSCPVPYLNTEIKFCVGKTSPTMPNLNWLHCKLLFHSILLFISWPDRRCLVQSKFQQISLWW